MISKAFRSVRFLGISLALSLLYWVILIYVIWNDGSLKSFRYMGF